MSLAISSIREAIRCYEGTTNLQMQAMWAEKVRGIGKNCPETAPWAAAFEICVAYNAEQERACAAWKVERELEMAAGMEGNQTPALLRREAMRDAILGSANSCTADLTPAQLFAIDLIPRWLRSSWDYTGASDARTRVLGVLA